MRYDLMARTYGVVFGQLLRSYYRCHLPDRDWRAICRRVASEYRAMVERTPGVGGRENLLTPNLVMACFLFSVPKVDPQMTPELMDAMLDEAMSSNFMRRLNAGAARRGTQFSDASHDRRVRAAARSKTSPYEMDWKFDYVAGADEFWFTYTECGICKLARREDTCDYLPCLCRTDFKMYELVGARLGRTMTLAAGDPCCDFHVVRE